jgi:hypothetical protein
LGAGGASPGEDEGVAATEDGRDQGAGEGEAQAAQGWCDQRAPVEGRGDGGGGAELIGAEDELGEGQEDAEGEEQEEQRRGGAVQEPGEHY